MKKSQELANDRYKELCAQYGDLTIRLAGMQKDLENLLKQINTLNDHVPVMHMLEDAILAQIKADQENMKDKVDTRPAQKLTGITNLVESDK